MVDPLTALMYAVQFMNFLKALVTKTLKERESSVVEASPFSHVDPSDKNGHQGPLQLCLEKTAEENEVKEQSFIAEDPHSETACDFNYTRNISDEEHLSYTITEESDGGRYVDTSSRISSVDNTPESSLSSPAKFQVEDTAQASVVGQSSESNYSSKISEKMNGQQIVVQSLGSIDSKGISSLSRDDSRSERIEAWR